MATLNFWSCQETCMSSKQQKNVINLYVAGNGLKFNKYK